MPTYRNNTSKTIFPAFKDVSKVAVITSAEASYETDAEVAFAAIMSLVTFYIDPAHGGDNLNGLLQAIQENVEMNEKAARHAQYAEMLAAARSIVDVQTGVDPDEFDDESAAYTALVAAVELMRFYTEEVYGPLNEDNNFQTVATLRNCLDGYVEGV